MVVRLYIHQDVDWLMMPRISMCQGSGEKTLGAAALDDGRVVAIGGQHAGGVARVGRAYHREQRLRHGSPVDGELGIEYLVPAMLRVCLRKHHELHIGGVALQV